MEIKKQDTNLPSVNKESVTGYLNSAKMQSYLSDVIGNNKDKFVTNLVSVTNQNKDLQKCTNMSLVSGAIVATTLNLSLNSSFGYAYLVPFKNGKLSKDKGFDVHEAQFQIGYKGYIQLALRTGEYKRINAVPIYKSQFQGWDALTEDLKLNAFDNFDNDEIIGYVAYFRLTNGFEKTMFWSHDKMMKHADTYSNAFSSDSYKKLQDGKIPERDTWKYSSYWYKDFPGMALKTMLRQTLSKYGIMSEEMQKAYDYDQSVVQDNQPNYIDNQIGNNSNDDINSILGD
jgi:recombination protein RecT